MTNLSGNAERYKMTPREVMVHYSEAGSEVGDCEERMPFAEFEARAYRAAMGHTTGGYLKTKITVFFDDPESKDGESSYTCRIDLALHDEKGFRDGIEKRISYFEDSLINGSSRPDHMHDQDKALYFDWWTRIDFDGIGEPVELESKAFRSDLTPAGEQLVIPGCEIDSQTHHSGALQLSLF